MSLTIRVVILFGGQSAEHEVSLQSAKNIIAALDRQKYELLLVGIDKQGRWLLYDDNAYLQNSENPKTIRLCHSEIQVVLANDEQGKPELINIRAGASLGPVDVVFPVLHGTLGEDGAMQGLLKLVNVPFVGADVVGSAVGMDKDIMKRLLRDAEIPMADFIVVQKHKPDVFTFHDICDKLGTPLFIKPANAGSSVGIQKIDSEETYQAALTDAFTFDHKVIVEEFLDGREIECSVLGNEQPVASLPGEIIPAQAHEFYSYQAKYLDPEGARLQIPAELTPVQKKKIQYLALKTFEVLACEGMARVDMFLTPDDAVYVNEINTIPGFTQISMYPKLWAISGIPYPELLDRLLHLAMQRHSRDILLRKSYL